MKQISAAGFFPACCCAGTGYSQIFFSFERRRKQGSRRHKAGAPADITVAEGRGGVRLSLQRYTDCQEMYEPGSQTIAHAGNSTSTGRVLVFTYFNGVRED